jgi:hypothetical protein
MPARHTWLSFSRRRYTRPAPGSQSRSPTNATSPNPGNGEDALQLQPPLDGVAHPHDSNRSNRSLVAHSWAGATWNPERPLILDPVHGNRRPAPGAAGGAEDGTSGWLSSPGDRRHPSPQTRRFTGGRTSATTGKAWAGKVPCGPCPPGEGGAELDAGLVLVAQPGHLRADRVGGELGGWPKMRVAIFNGGVGYWNPPNTQPAPWWEPWIKTWTWRPPIGGVQVHA